MTKKKVIRRIKKPKVICSVCDEALFKCGTCGCKMNDGDTCWCYARPSSVLHFCSEECLARYVGEEGEAVEEGDD